jgi:hypothetical protein
MRLRWDKYFYDLFSGVLRHVGTALIGWTGVNAVNAAGVDVQPLNLEHLGWFVLSAAIIPSIAAFWQKTPLPEIDAVIVKTETTVTAVKPVTPPNEPHNPSADPPNFPRQP